MNEYKVAFVKSGKWYAAFVPDLPGAHSQGRTLAEARRNIRDAISLVIESNHKRFRSETRGKRVVKDVVRVAA